MATNQACDCAGTGGAVQHVKTMRVRTMGYRLGLIVLLAASMAAPVFAQDTNQGGNDGVSGYYGSSYKPGAAPAAATTVPRNHRQTNSTELAPQRFIAPDASGLAYQPGFHGCAPLARADSGIGSLRTALVARPPEPPQNADRYMRFGLSVGETYTDNVGLDSDGNEDSAWVAQVIPSIQACADTARIKASLNYQIQALYYAGSDESNKVYNHVSAATTAEIVPGHLFLSADSSYGQAVINPSATFADTNVLRPGNRTSAWVTNISPYWFQELGPLGQATLRYRFGRTEYGDSDISDYTLNGAYLNLSNPPSNQRWSYDLSVATQRLERDTVKPAVRMRYHNDSGVTHFDSATLQVGYNVTESLQLFTTGGVEDDYKPNGDVDRFGSAIWNVGFRWASPSNSLQASYGERSFGSSWSVQATHHASLFDLTLAYDEDTTGAGLNDLNRGNIAASGAFQGPLSPLGDRGVYVRKRLSATLALDTERTHVTLQGYDESREFLTRDIPDEDVYGADLGARYQLGERTALLPRLRWEHHSSSDTHADIAAVSIGAAYLLTPSSQVAASYGHSWRNGETDADSYDENRVTAQYSVFF